MLPLKSSTANTADSERAIDHPILVMAVAAERGEMQDQYG